jgi:hypothetical protein
VDPAAEGRTFVYFGGWKIGTKGIFGNASTLTIRARKITALLRFIIAA